MENFTVCDTKKSESFPKWFLDPTNGDISFVAGILEANPKQYNIRCRNNLCSYYVYERNFLASKNFLNSRELPYRVKHLILLNNPKVVIKSIDQYKALVELIRDGKERHKINY
ncbi:MAG TPA: hypothetical protein VG895_03480 [Patescibacteria group bacterium]|nr:hypothetical protein [Patescibacteria group bacterium]